MNRIEQIACQILDTQHNAVNWTWEDLASYIESKEWDLNLSEYDFWKILDLVTEDIC